MSGWRVWSSAGSCAPPARVCGRCPGDLGRLGEAPGKKYGPSVDPAGRLFDASVAGLVTSRWERPTGHPEGEREMRVMVLVKATEQSEAGVLPSEELLAAMG